jgi:hypothetical protein
MSSPTSSTAKDNAFLWLKFFSIYRPESQWEIACERWAIYHRTSQTIDTPHTAQLVEWKKSTRPNDVPVDVISKIQLWNAARWIDYKLQGLSLSVEIVS